MLSAREKAFKEEERHYVKTETNNSSAKLSFVDKIKARFGSSNSKGELKSNKILKIVLVTALIAVLAAGTVMFIGCTPKENGGNGGTEIVTPITPDQPVITPDQPVITPDDPVVNPDDPTVDPTDPVVTTTLFDAVREVNLDAVKALVESGADINEVDEDGCTPLLLAAIYPKTGLIDIVKYLVEQGATIDLNEKIGETNKTALELILETDQLDETQTHKEIVDYLQSVFGQQVVTNMSFEDFMTNRDAIAYKIVEKNESAILLSNATKGLAAQSEVKSYSINLTETQNCNEISAFEITYLMEKTNTGDQYIATSTITLSQSITNSNYEDLTIANIEGHGKTSISAEDSQQTELKAALAEAFLAKAGISFNYTADDISLCHGGTTLSQTYGNADSYTIVISNDNGVVKLNGYVKTSSNALQEVENDHIESVTGERLEDFHTLAEHTQEAENA